MCRFRQSVETILPSKVHAPLIMKATYIANYISCLSMALRAGLRSVEKSGCVICLVKLILNAMRDILGRASTEAKVVLQLWFGSFDLVIVENGYARQLWHIYVEAPVRLLEGCR
jgi:hypothetical protein